MSKHLPITGVILAGGAGRRMQGQDKGLLRLQDRPLAAWLAERLAPQVDELLIVANRNVDQYAALGYPVIQDLLPDFAGPLAGIEAALSAARHDTIITFPVDSPCPPKDYAERMETAASGNAAVAIVRGEIQAVCALLPRQTLPSLQSYLARGDRQVKRWLAAIGAVEVDFSDCATAFRDVDTAEDLLALQGSAQQN